MKIGLIYTCTPIELVQCVENEVKGQFGSDVILLSYSDPSILDEIREAGAVTKEAAARLVCLYMEAIKDGADILLNVCSSVGQVAKDSRNLCESLQVPLVRIDELMCAKAVEFGSKIGVVATLPTTLNPTKQLLLEQANKQGATIELVDCLVEVFGATKELFRESLKEAILDIRSGVDVVILCQGSMAYCEGYLGHECDVPILSSPHFGALDLRARMIDSLGKNSER